jgi:hypothetical protein
VDIGFTQIYNKTIYTPPFNSLRQDNDGVATQRSGVFCVFSVLTLISISRTIRLMKIMLLGSPISLSSTASHRGGPGSIPRQVMLDSRWKNGILAGFLQVLRVSLPILIPKLLHIHYLSYHQRYRVTTSTGSLTYKVSSDNVQRCVTFGKGLYSLH